ncbi:MAG: glycoside hydrolase family 1 protein [Candidatus Sericytochromatia bacterium]
MAKVFSLRQCLHVLAMTASVLLAACVPTVNQPETAQLSSFQFPKDFQWGTSTSAYQVEGGISNDWSQAGLDAGQAVNHWERYEEDFAQAEKMHTNTYRFSVEWSRIEPRKGQWDMAAVAHYRKMIQAMKKHGLKPMLTLFHFTSPVWFMEQGGWTRADNIQDYLNFVRFIVGELKADVDVWLTLNEPLVYAFKSYDAGEWPPMLKDRKLTMEVIKNLAIGHGKAYRLIHELQPRAEVSFAHNITLLQANWVISPLDHLVTSVSSSIFNEAFWNAIEAGQLDLSPPGTAPLKIPYSAELKGSLDFIGVNYYTRYQVDASGKLSTRAGADVSDQNWEIYPDGILEALRLADKHAKQLQIPIVITENGLDDASDEKRSRFILSHLYRVWQAIREGIPVRGYMHWSLIDNYEWADGWKPKFGLMTTERKWRPAAGVYADIARANGFSLELYRKFVP